MQVEVDFMHISGYGLLNYLQSSIDGFNLPDIKIYYPLLYVGGVLIWSNNSICISFSEMMSQQYSTVQTAHPMYMQAHLQPRSNKYMSVPIPHQHVAVSSYTTPTCSGKFLYHTHMWW